MKTKILTTEEEIKAFSDPYRLKILSHYHRLNEPATVKQIADKMEQTPAKVHYHVKKLEKAGILELSHTKEVNGIIAKYYKPTAGDFQINNKEIDNSIRNVMLNESQKMIANIYDNSKEYVVRSFDKYRNTKKGELKSSSGVVGGTEIYLTDKEHEEFLEYIDKFVEKHQNKGPSNKKVYHFFRALFEIDEDD
ncbi:ArsR/SmtB family transcription factor [Dethiothermospora halolimnae]|uniref:ArsR/SmtB family transcription factor n=1 Tax=Dethiothermospora halolimnae TaxID=3114390 RepID=UPI003CCBA19D